MSQQYTLLRNLMFLFVIIVVGCSSYPQARYYKAPPNPDKDKKILVPFAPDKKNLIPFSLQGALVTIAPKPAPAATKEEKTNQSKAQLDALGLTIDPKPVASIEDLKNGSQAFATQADAANSIYFLEPKDDFLTKSNISVTYYDGQHRIKAIGTEFQDDRIKVIQALGGAVAAVVPILLAPPTKAPPAPLGKFSNYPWSSILPTRLCSHQLPGTRTARGSRSQATQRGGTSIRSRMRRAAFSRPKSSLNLAMISRGSFPFQPA